jgi:O-antigen ligase
LDGFVRLLAIPLLMTQFSRSAGGRRVLIGFLASCVVLLAASFVLILWPQLHPRPATLEGVPVKSYIAQGLEFAMCAAAVLEIARVKAAARQWKYAAAFVGLGAAFLVDVFFLSAGRTTLVIIPALLVVYGLWRSGWKGFVGASVAAAVLASVVWFASPFVRQRVMAIYTETMSYEQHNDASSSGTRIEFWKKSLRFISSAPVFGHGTGSIVEQFKQAEAGQGASAIPSSNPHNQTFAVGIQLGLVGMAALWAMWIAQLLLFRGAGLAAWTGLVVVTANIVGSLFNSFIFDFTEGWIYVIGVGVAAGMVRRSLDAAAAAAQGS